MQKYICKREQKFAELSYSSDTVSQTKDSDETDSEDSELEFGDMGCMMRRQRRRDFHENQKNPRRKYKRQNSAILAQPYRKLT
jgi:hypothetical protein